MQLRILGERAVRGEIEQGRVQLGGDRGLQNRLGDYEDAFLGRFAVSKYQVIARYYKGDGYITFRYDKRLPISSLYILRVLLFCMDFEGQDFVSL